MRTRLLVVVLALLVPAVAALARPKGGREPTLVFDRTPGGLPYNSRSTGDGASGSAEPTAAEFSQLASLMATGPVVVVDLRQESHGFLDGAPVSWMGANNQANAGKTLEAIEADEQGRLAALRSRTVTVATEAEVARSHGLQYLRIPVKDYSHPDDGEVDRFVAFVRALPPGAHLHFHCKAGKGRTTTFLAMYDALRFGKEMSFEDIVARQARLGGYDLLAGLDPATPIGRQAAARAAFVKAFHGYCRRNQDGFATPWSARRSVRGGDR